MTDDEIRAPGGLSVGYELWRCPMDCGFAIPTINRIGILRHKAEHFTSLREEVLRLRAALEAQRADTERLDWLESRRGRKRRFRWWCDSKVLGAGITYGPFNPFSGADDEQGYCTVRDAIDAARQRDAKEKP